MDTHPKTTQDWLIELFKDTLYQKKILLGITGSISAFKTIDLIRLLKKCGAEVQAILSPGGENFVTRATLEAITEKQVLTTLWEPVIGKVGTHHIETARWADLFMIAPASANIIAKLACGIADDLITTEFLAFQGPKIICPAMNPAMFANASVQHNVELLKQRHADLTWCGPEVGLTSCGEEGLGRLAEVSLIFETVALVLNPKTKSSKRVLISLGPTQSFMDPVRFLSNRSSGTMGVALAWEFFLRGHQVTLISGPIDETLPISNSTRMIKVRETSEMEKALHQLWPSCDYFVSSAAVLDWEFSERSTQKIKKEPGSSSPPSFLLKKTSDLLAWAGESKKSNQKILGFAAETQEFVENAKRKLTQKNCDAVFVNPISTQTGFESFENQGWLVEKSGRTQEFSKTSKIKIAKKLVEWMENS